MQKPDKRYKAAGYLRLSKEDGDFSISPNKRESESISSQRELCERFAREAADIALVAEFVDDGFTGTNFDRPRFQDMLEAIKRGEINCVIVKDLSRFGRDYIEAGIYLEKIFPQLGVRFIAINDHYDSLEARGGNDGILLPFKNLINDSYSRDISIKVRSNLETKRRKGEFIANFPVYGYLRSPEDKNRLLVDEAAAPAVRDIFRWRIEGLSTQKIADRLNGRGTLPPMEHKRHSGSNYKTCFKTTGAARWSAVAVHRILTNEVYTGTLVQGRRTTPNYKVKKVILKDESQWVRAEEAHEAIVSPAEYHLVQALMKRESRSAPGAEAVHPLSGMIFCGACGKRAKRTSACHGGRTYAYYNCPRSAARPRRPRGGEAAPEKTAGCPSCSIREEALESAVLATLQAQIGLILDMEQALRQVDGLAWEKREVRRLDAEIAVQEGLIEKNKHLKLGIYEDLRDGLITKQDFSGLKEQFSLRIQAAGEAIAALRRERGCVNQGLTGRQGWLAQFHQYKNITGLHRALVVNLVDRIELYPERQIGVVLRHRDQFAELTAFLASQGLDRPGPEKKKEAG